MGKVLFIISLKYPLMNAINIKLNDGEGFAEAYGCDLTYDYVKINGDYRT